MESNTIVTICRNEPLQTQRTQVLEAAGYCVVALGLDAEVMEFLSTGHQGRAIGLILLCRSVPELSRITLCDALKKAYPETPILMLYSDGYEKTTAKIDGSLFSIDSPKSFLGMIGLLSGRRGDSN